MVKEDQHRKRARLWLKVPIDETIGRSLENESLEEDLCILGVPQILSKYFGVLHYAYWWHYEGVFYELIKCIY